MSSSLKDLRDFLFRGLMVESEAGQFQSAGIQVGAHIGQAEERLLSDAIAPFNLATRNRALEMGRLYVVLHCFENFIRAFIRETLEEKEGADWPDKLPARVKKYAEDRQKESMKDSWLEGEKADVLGFTDFGHLASIMVEKWSCFEGILPSQHWLKQRMDELEKCRHFIAHNRMLLPSEFQRIYMYISDWNRVVGL
ncbi:Swt1 family HEPN domain-containing protein [Sinimarinibacterium flocculans]|uniref:Swt1 family HEPN domain-containing protein n=1 Tax=Sinimarinibacterium flocculans TaxID=985250 RepID=UPI003511578C